MIQTVAELMQSQLLDPFRIGLMIGLVYTMLRTQAATGRLIPLAAGVVFVAVILPSTMPGGEAGLGTAIAAGILSNLIILGIVLLGWSLVSRLRR